MSLLDDSKDGRESYVSSDPINRFPRHFDFHLSNAVVASIPSPSPPSTRESDFSKRKNASPIIGTRQDYIISIHVEDTCRSITPAARWTLFTRGI